MSSSRLKPGTPAPTFKADLWDGDSFDLNALRGKKVWLAFFRYAACPLCNLRVHEIIKQYETFQKCGLEIVAVFQSPKTSITKYVGMQKPPFPLVADPDERLYELYRVESNLMAFLSPGNLPIAGKALQLGFMPGKPDGTMTRIPADFLIDEQGVIREAFYGDKIADHIPFESVLRFASAPVGRT